MANLSIAEFTVSPPSQIRGGTCFLRMWFNEAFTNSAGQDMQWGASNPSNWYYNFECTIDSDGIIHVPALAIVTTTDGNPITSTMSARFYTAQNRPLNWLFQSKVIPADIAPATTWEVLQDTFQYSHPVNPQPDSVSLAQMKTYVDSRSSGAGAPKLTTVTFGIARGSKAAADPTNPIVLMNTEPIYTGTTGVRSISEFSSLANAISQIGSTPTTLLIPTTIMTNSVTIPSTLTIDPGVAGVISVNSGQTVTFNGPVIDPGNRVWLNGTGHKVFGKISRINLNWFYDGSTNTVGALAINDIITSISSQGSGILFAPAGDWNTTGGHEAVSGMTWEGGGMDSATPSRILLDASNTYLCHIGPSLRNIQFKNLCLSTDKSGNYGVVAEGDTSESTIGLTFDLVRFENFNQGVRVHALTSGFECKNVVYNQCEWVGTTVDAIYCDAINCDMTFLGGYGLIGADSDFFHMENIGYFQAIGMTFEGPSNAGCSGATPSPLKARNVLYLGADHGPVNILNCRDEGFQYWATIDAQTDDFPITFISNQIQSIIRIRASCLIKSSSSRYFRNAFISDGIASARIESNFDTVRATDYCLNAGTATPNGLTTPSIFVELQDEIQTLWNQYLALVASPIYDGTLTRPWLKIITEEVGKYLFQIGTASNHYSWLRDSSGFLQAIGSQVIANRGFGFNGPILQTAEQSTLPASPASQAIIGLNTSHFLQWNTNGGATKNFVGATTTLHANKLQKATADGIIADSAITENAGAVSWSGSLVVTGSGAFSTTLAVSGTSTLSVVNAGATAVTTFSASGAATFSSTVTVATSLAIGGGTALTKAVVYAPSLTPASVAANISAEQDFTVTGLATSDKVILNNPAPTAGTGIVGVRVKLANTLSITFANFTSGALTPAAGVYPLIAIRS